jgi:antiviral helicase SKI2
MKRLQVKEREASGQPPLTRMGQNAGKQGQQRGQQRGRADKRGARGSHSSSHFSPAMIRGGGGGPNSGRGHQEDQNRWVHLVGMLKKKELLPVVAFTFSKKRCEENATSMPNTDLCSAKEKSEIHIVIERGLTRLNGRFC